MQLLLALALFAQAFVEPPTRAYTLADPVRPDGIGIATPDGRWAVSRGDNCDSIGPEMNVELWQAEGFTGIGVIAQVAGDGVIGAPCNIRFEQRVSDVPCFTNDAGDCDVAAN